MRIPTAFILAAIGAMCAFCQGPPPPPSSFSGVILTDDGRPVPGAWLHYQKLTEYRNVAGHRQIREPGFGRSVQVGSDGVFSVSGLTAGTYYLCAGTSQVGQIGDCAWDAPPVIKLAIAQDVRGIVRRIHEAVTLTIRVNDSNGRIEMPDLQGRVAPARRFFLAVRLEELSRQAQLVSSSTTQKVYQINFPWRRKARFFIDSELRVTDAAGTSVETRRPTTLSVEPTNAAPITIDLFVN